MHDLKTERFFKPEMVNYAMMFGDGKNNGDLGPVDCSTATQRAL
jgi:hypothetical protein